MPDAVPESFADYAPRSERWTAERADEIEWLSREHGMSPSAMSELLGPDGTVEELCVACLVWLTGIERTVCGYCST